MPAPNPVAADGAIRRVAWLTVALFLSYLCVAMSLPVVSVFVTARLGFSNALSGLAVGIAFASTILTRGLAGRIADGVGGKHCMVRGLRMYVLAGLVCAATGGVSASLGLLVVAGLLRRGASA